MRDLRAFANQGRAVGGGPPPLRRPDPSTLGVHMGAPNPRVGVHARHRLERQLRILGFVFLLRHNGEIPHDADVTLAPTTLQHGQGGEGEAAAHKAIAVPAFGGTALHDVPADVALHTFLVFLVSETSVIPSACNGADGAVEDELRDVILRLVRDIVSEDDHVPTLQGFSERMAALWSTLRASYLTACRNATHTVLARKKHQTGNYAQRSARIARGDPIPETKLLDAKRKAAVASLILMVLDEYREKAKAMPFPLSPGELENMYNLVVHRTF